MNYEDGATHPYYIAAPDYRESSAGVRVMHRLCHMLNTQGLEAYVVGAEVVHPQLLTPCLDSKTSIRHRRENRVPIAVYPDIITGNPLNAPVCVRYMLNKEGVIEGNPLNAGADDLFFYYSRAFTPNTAEKFDYLRLNTNDLETFKPDPQKAKRGPLLYLNRIPPSAVNFATLPKDIEVLSNQTPLSLPDLAAKLQSATVLYSYESSATCTLAMLCDCPVVVMTLPGFEHLGFTKQSLSIYNGKGYAFTDSEEALAAARRGLEAVRKGVANVEQAFLQELAVFVQKTQHKAEEVARARPPVSLPDALYQDWIATHQFQASDAREYERRIAQWTQPPHFRIAVVHDDAADAQALARSLQSLARQYYPGVAVSVFTPLPAPEGLNAGRLEWFQSAQSWEAAAAALHDAGADDWVGLVRAGDVVAPHGLLVLAEYLNARPQLQAVYTDEDVIEADGRRHSPRFKPDFDLEWLRGSAYVGGLLLAKTPVWRAAGGWQHFPDHEDEFDLALRLAEHLPAAAFGHLPDVLYHRGAQHPARTRAEVADQPQLPHLQQHLARCAPDTLAGPGLIPGTSRIVHPLPATPRVSVLIPATGPLAHLQRCIESLFEQTDYPDFELLVIGHQGLDPAAQDFLAALQQLGDNRLKVLHCEAPSPCAAALFNPGAQAATGSLLLLLEPGVAALHRDWLGEMVALIQQAEVGAVGARLLHADGTLRHGGYLLGLEDTAGSPLAGHPAEEADPLGRNLVAHAVQAVSSACLLIRQDTYLALGGLDAEQFPRAYADVDLCLRLRAQGLRVLWTPFATLLHSGAPDPAPKEETAALHRRWMAELVRDPGANPNLSLQDAELEPEPEAALSWNPTPWNPLPRVLAHPVNQHGSGQYRMLNPLRGLHDANRCRGYASQRFFSPVEIAKAEMDTIVVQLPGTARHLRALESYRQYSGAKCIVEVDDLITAIPPSSPLHKVFGEAARDYLQRSMRIADRLVVTTDALAAAFANAAPEVVVSRNYLVATQWENLNPAQHPRQKPRVGWAGSDSHLGDLGLLRDVVPALARDVDWIFFGTCPADLRPYVKEFYGGVPFEQYPAALASLGLDLALAPLESNAFNEAKSNLKLLEYGILGYPVVCSNVGPYRQGFPVKRVNNTSKAWIAAIRERIHDLKAARREGAALQAHVRQHWMLEDHLDEWQAAWAR
ncbi:glycosyltransferase [Azoarcus olearius]|uniref:glycosyltransferase n=1 Tax=Azoarcus sp. (strain BH72) TaxID=418699 RepID=UPI0008063718|nr:glycosyltransferase [Azoarcus olearius]ANQ85865.1 glycosyltransferase [Azoarcus olearius]